MDFALSSLASGMSPETVWGLVPRIMGLLYVVAFTSISVQVMAAIGSRGIAPVAQMLAASRQNVSSPRRYFDTPTVFWLNTSDGFIRAVPLIGIASGLVAIHGGPLGFPALLVCWALYISLDVCALMFPWDCLLLEAGFLALFLPGVHALPEITPTALPLPVVAFMFQLLIIRLMWGFAKLKFIGTKKGDDLYLRGFLAWMPMCSPLGWLMQHAPNWFLKLSYAFMWTVEVVFPGLCFFTGAARMIGGLGLIALMGGIWATGNWGFFNVGYGLLCIVMFDTQTSLFDASLADVTAAPITHAAMAIVAFGSLLYFPGNSWASQTLMQWCFDDITYKRPWLERLIGFYRFLAPFRIVNAYGVFPPNSSPPLKVVPVFEGSRDGVKWEGYGYKFMPTTERSGPPIVAPHHPRIDHAAIYAGAGMTDSDYLAGLVGAGKTYSLSPFSHYSWLHRVSQRLLEGEPALLKVMGENPFKDEPPRYVRVALRALTPASLAERRATGNAWRMRHIGLAFPAMQKDPLVWQYWLSPPECFHPDFVARRRRSPALEAMVAAYKAGKPVHEAVRVESDLTAIEVERFWSEIVPAIAETRGDFRRAAPTAKHLEARYGKDAMIRFERIGERYAWMMRIALEPYMWGDAQPKIEKRSNFRFHTLLQEIVLDGREAYETMLREPTRAAERATQQTKETALHFIGVFRAEMIAYHVATQRVAERITTALDAEIPGILEFRELLTRDAPEGEVWLPKCERSPDGEWTIEGFDGIDAEPPMPAFAAE